MKYIFAFAYNLFFLGALAIAFNKFDDVYRTLTFLGVFLLFFTDTVSFSTLHAKNAKLNIMNNLYKSRLLNSALEVNDNGSHIIFIDGNEKIEDVPNNVNKPVRVVVKKGGKKIAKK